MSNTRSSVPLTTQSISPDPSTPSDPWVLSYFAQRRIAGWIGILLPIVVAAITIALDSGHYLPDSISASYYTIARNYFVGSLCSVGVFLISAVGYDEDRLLSFVAGALAFIVAFSPCTPPAGSGITPVFHSPQIHGAAAILLFLDLAWICLFRFTRTGNQQTPATVAQPMTRQKKKRNVVFKLCGGVMVAAMVAQVVFGFLEKMTKHHIDHLTYSVEAVCLVTFGLAWIVKGQQLFADEPSS